MEDRIGFLSEAEIEQIVKLVEVLERSSFDFLQLEVGDLKLTISKGGRGEEREGGPSRKEDERSSLPRTQESAAIPPSPVGVRETPRSGPGGEEPSPKREQDGSATSPTATAVEEAVFIRAPIVGRFYAQPEPGAPPFVTVGTFVEEDTTVGLIEVMKVFNAVRAGVRGVITEILVQDGQFVEFGQPLFRVRPA
ncbi:MAG: biotin/lipoyl-containing protein [Armatimonadota bacterium]|nr:biotin/lipoyl-containing protein [Armatimonadota bacterium]MDR7443888.1 biotin/lipoyl-containing protein [Armatimonadota bacterium]MDR7571069.1 biotin/lipoyl-containing protein [Armatimonadota bacterium]MDR7615470.1 biotin/lipoyl-containing protein [Armatimonadota bacterium]